MCKENLTLQNILKDMCSFWLIWFINQRTLYNHDLPISFVIVSVSIVVVRVQSS